MQITIDIPDNLANKFNALPNPKEFIINLLSHSLDSGLNQDQWGLLLENIEDIAVDTGLTDLSEKHDDYLGKL